MMLTIVLPALAQDAEGWFGAGGGAHAAYTIDTPDPLGIMLQAEADFGYSSGIFTLEGQVDVHVNPLGNEFLASGGDVVVICPDAFYAGTSDPILTCPRPVEQLTAQLGGESWRVQAGILSMPIGVEGWDSWDNVLPLTTSVFDMTPGGVGGALFGYTLGDGGPELFLYGGYDLGWNTPEGGLGVAFDGDAMGTWSGVWAMPMYGYYAGDLAFSFYLGDNFWLNASALGGVYDGSFGVGGFAQGILFPEGVFRPSLRVGGGYDPDGAFAFAPFNAGLGASVVPLDWLSIQAQADVDFVGASIRPTIGGGVNIIPQLPE